MRRIFFQIVVLAAAVSSLVACSKSDNSGQPGPTRMRWINVVPNMGFDIYSNQEEVASDLPFDTLTGYAAGLPGFYNLRVVKTGTSDTLVNGNQQLQSGIYYSMFLLPDTSGGQINTNKATVSIVTENTLSPVAGIDTLKLRFFNFAPFSPAIDVVMSIEGRTLPADTLRPFLRRIYNDQSYSSNYTQYGLFRSNNRWKFDLYNASEGVGRQPIKTFYQALNAGSVYTLYIKPIVGMENTDTFDFKFIQKGYVDQN
ncbi:MAG: hypothetical protein DI598_08965 [Pseudopedobacter saltans]|uniref:DUF4397 domain-containing protein n=1 Tax=Pseudopedobacter saltans TaxID=151895 RepID=A0A2W5GT21_9SPHI|nr:MAG: hypothetical protein DI598_08965 [Pseudopedobacter saltans]